MNLYTEHYKKLDILKYNYEKIIDKFCVENDFDKKLELALFAAEYFVYNNCGYYTSSILENFFIDFAKEIMVDLKDINYVENSVLHVLSEGYLVGGHTRVVERWIENAPKSQKHSVVFTRQNFTNLKVLECNVKSKNGEFISLNNNLTLKDKAIELRKLAMNYEFIVLHTHMEDPLPIISFGSEDFTRPVLLYNHASHLPWLGKSIADLVLDIEKDDIVTKENRKITNTYFLGVPSKTISLSIPDKIQARKALNLPLDKKIIISSGADERFSVICGNDFIEYLENIMDENTYCYVIGVSKDNPNWDKIKKETNGRVVTLGFIDFDKGFLDYLKAADLYLDSYPFCGGTATIDAVACGIPVVSLKSAYPQFDYLTTTSSYCKDKNEFIYKAMKVLNNVEYANELRKEVQNSLINYQSIEAWNSRIEKLFKIVPKVHCVNIFDEDICICNDLLVLCNAMLNKNFIKCKKINKILEYELKYQMTDKNLYKKQGIPFVLEILSYKNLNNKVKVFKIFGIVIYSKQFTK